jgi:hypothetical protein
VSKDLLVGELDDDIRKFFIIEEVALSASC